MARNHSESPSPLPIPAHLRSIEIVGDFHPNTNHSSNRPHYFVTVYVDETQVARSEKKPGTPFPRWEWPDSPGLTFFFHPLASIKIQVRHKVGFTNELVGKYTGDVIDVLNNSNAMISLEDKTGGIAVGVPKLKIDVILSSDPEKDDCFKNLMQDITTNIARLDSAPASRSPILSALRTVFQFTKKIMDIVAGAHPDPILKTSWAVISAVYTAVEQAQHLDDTVRGLAEKLREVLGIAKEHPDLLVVKGTTNVIQEIGRTSLKVTSLIHEFTRPNFRQRIVNAQFSEELKLRAAECEKDLNELEKKFNTRMAMGISNVVNEIRENAAAIKDVLETNQDDQLANKIWIWLSAPDSSPNYNAAREKRQAGTCDWVLKEGWLGDFLTEAGFFWIEATSGCGKTVLCAFIIERIIEICKKKWSAASAYFFFDGRDAQKSLQFHNGLIRSLIRQLSDFCDGIPPALADLYHRYHGHQQATTNELQDTLQQIINALPSVYIIIDSLDECVDGEKLLKWIQEIIQCKKENLHVVFASRPKTDIENLLQSPRLGCCRVKLAQKSNRGIKLYLKENVSILANEKAWSEETQQAVESTLLKGAGGMFQWVSLQLSGLKKCPDERSVLKQLKSLPKGLEKTYNHILSSIDEDYRLHVQTFLRWLCFSERALSLREIADTVTVDFDIEDGPKYVASRRYKNEWDVLEKCSALVTESKGKVKLAHFSIKEYLLSKELHSAGLSTFYLISAKHSHSIISQTCLAYLLHFDLPDSLQKGFERSFPLARYAAKYWVEHTYSAHINESETAFNWILACRLFNPNGITLNNWVRIWDVEHPWEGPKLARTISAKPLYYASFAGVAPVVKHLLKNKADVNAVGGEDSSAMQAASRWGYTAIVKLLLANGANVNLAGGKYGSALQAASHWGHIVIVELLLEHGANVNLAGGIYGSALQVASRCGYTAIVELLLGHGANINLAGGKYGSALQAASHQGHTEIVKLLLKNGADVDLLGKLNESALQAASAGGYIEIVKLLLANGADMNLGVGVYGSALQAVSEEGHTEIVRLLLEHGADANLAGGKYGSALQAASRWGHTAIIKLLLKHGADVNLGGGQYGSALQAASWWGDIVIVKLLLEHGADVNLGGAQYGSALQDASVEGHTAIVKLLLQNGADVNLQGGEYGSALQAAIILGYDDIVKLLRRAGGS